MSSTGEEDSGVDQQYRQPSTSKAEATSEQEGPSQATEPSTEPLRPRRESTLPKRLEDYEVYTLSHRREGPKAHRQPEDSEAGDAVQEYAVADERLAAKAKSTSSKTSYRSSRSIGQSSTTSKGSVREAHLQLYHGQRELEMTQLEYKEEEGARRRIRQLDDQEEELARKHREMDARYTAKSRHIVGQKLAIREQLARERELRKKSLEVEVRRKKLELIQDTPGLDNRNIDSVSEADIKESRTNEWVGKASSRDRDVTQSGNNLVDIPFEPHFLPQSVPANTAYQGSVDAPATLQVGLPGVSHSVTNNAVAYGFQGHNAAGQGRACLESTGLPRNRATAVVNISDPRNVQTLNPIDKVRTPRGITQDIVRFKPQDQSARGNSSSMPNFPASGNAPPNNAFTAPTQPSYDRPCTYLEARIAQDVVKLPKFTSGDVEDYLDFRRAWEGSESLLAGLDEVQKYNRLLEQLGGEKNNGPKFRAQRQNISSTLYTDTWVDSDEYYARYTVVFEASWIARMQGTC